MFAGAVQMLVPARRASPFSTRQLHSLPGLSTQLAPLSRRHISSHKAVPPQENSASSFNLWAQIREARPAVRYTVYAGLGLMATAETTFWFNVIKSKYFPSKNAEEQDEAAQFLEDLRAVIKGYRAVWMQNYNRYYGAYVWGADYSGLDGLRG
ncbi:hypothetical protein BU25DRAFT_410833 [Macroventuria anomochaeta]|uniref:Uncharacterized protein n=1 Tax=Macroventuria anomochaeta TaxID=301207 RepID=A0ACB6S087_9PLEO|nr:uncharacterized protein BU25DRAFT_410833 [Macroventuria anomochaeta]KAF2627696.1 hypothetical protein BU25DRAFT_410833 [Macroventuria anomochaeta]